MRFPDKMRRTSGASLIRDLRKRGVSEGPGSAAHHHSASKTRVNALVALRRARETVHHEKGKRNAERRCSTTAASRDAARAHPGALASRRSTTALAAATERHRSA
jgi:hypothetical protein